MGSLGIKVHLIPVEKPAPPLPRKPEEIISSVILSLPFNNISFVLSQSPRSFASARFQGLKPYKLLKILSLLSNIYFLIKGSDDLRPI